MKRSAWLWAVLVAILLLIGFWLRKPSMPPVSARIIGQTNDPSGHAWCIFEVTNSTECEWSVLCKAVFLSNHPSLPSVHARYTTITRGRFFQKMEPRSAKIFAFPELEEARNGWRVIVAGIDENGWGKEWKRYADKLPIPDSCQWWADFDFVFYGEPFSAAIKTTNLQATDSAP